MVQSPIIPGHEVVGDVVALGPGEKTWKIGDRYVDSYFIWHERGSTTDSSARSGSYIFPILSLHVGHAYIVLAC